MTSLTEFPRFAQLPGELQLQIWEQCLAGPSMHVFDVCFPSWQGNHRIDTAFSKSRTTPTDNERYDWCRAAAFLDEVDASESIDPSIYRHRARLLQTSRAAAFIAQPRWKNSNEVYLPAPGRRIQYDNDQDILLLRLGAMAPGVRSPALDNMMAWPSLDFDGKESSPATSRLGELLDAHWTKELADTLRSAKRIALNASEVRDPTSLLGVLQENAERLASCIQCGLEVLYLIHDPNVCTCGCDLWGAASKVGGMGLEAVQGVGKTYREVRVKTTDRFAELIDQSIRSQQLDAGNEAFLGVKLLLAQDD